VKHVAALAIERMGDEFAIGQGKVSYETYIRIINDFILPTIGRREITSITPTVIDQLDKKRIEIMGKAPTKSTMLKHNAALNRIFDEAVIHGFLTQDERHHYKSLSCLNFSLSSLIVTATIFRGCC